MAEEIPQAHLCTEACPCNCNWPACACHFPAGLPQPAATEVDYPCARCGADSLPRGVRAINKDGRTLDLCGDHVTEHSPALERQHWTIVALRVLAEASLQVVPS